LKTAVETALQPQASWEQAEAAIRFFDLYKDRPWTKAVFAPFIATYATPIILNAERFSRLHPAWATSTIAQLALRLPALVLGELPRLVRLDAAWAKRLAETITAATPTAAFSQAAVLLAVDRPWAWQVLQNAVQRQPHAASTAVQGLLAAPEGQRLFEEAALTDPRWVVGVASARLAESPAVLEALQRSADPYVQALAQVAQSQYPDERKARLALLVQDLTDHRLSLTDALRLSASEREYFRLLVAMKLAARHPRPRALEYTLKEEVMLLVERINGLQAQPEAVRFHAVESFAARELYILMTYGEADLFTSSYRGVFDRLLAQMRTAGLTGDQLLTQVNDLHFRVFVKTAATFQRLEAFLATIPSPVARWSLLVRCLQDIDATPDVTLAAVTAAELVEAPLDIHSRRLIRDTLTREYHRAEWEQRRNALAMYGLLAARFAERADATLLEADVVAIAQRYHSSLPSLNELSAAKLFDGERSIHRYFFYDNEDGILSFQSFLAQYQHAKLWKIEDNGAFVQVLSTLPQKNIEIYANKPLQSEAGAQEIAAVLRQRGLAPRVIVHRGHSTDADRTIEQIPVTAVLVFLGSCGGYRQLEAVLSQAPEAQVITTKGVGTHTVNDPLLKALNDSLLSGTDVVWADFWRHAGSLLASNPRFADYVPPDKNASVIFLKAYRTLTGEHQPAPPPPEQRVSWRATQPPCLGQQG
ncbi:MAG TPA: hypothetical protein VIH59_03350, partial [Candidatus Tectomicrobia bacterium]